jgi:CheY-like chemotaxis protein
MSLNRGRLLLILTGRDAPTVAELAANTGLSPTDVLRQLQQLVDHGFLVVGDRSGVAVYHLVPKTEPAFPRDSSRRILLVEDDVLLSEVVSGLLEDEDYTVVACAAPLEAALLMEHVCFDLVITDGFSKQPSGVFSSTADLLNQAGATPVALFSAHTLAVETALAAGFRDLITKPFDVDTLVRQVRMLLGARSDVPVTLKEGKLRDAGLEFESQS